MEINGNIWINKKIINEEVEKKMWNVPLKFNNKFQNNSTVLKVYMTSRYEEVCLPHLLVKGKFIPKNTIIFLLDL